MRVDRDGGAGCPVYWGAMNITVLPAESAEYLAALGILFQQLPADQRAEQIAQLMASVREETFSLAGLLLARDGARPVGAMLNILQGDGTVFMWPPVVLAGVDLKSVASALIAGAGRWIETQPYRLAQCLLDPGATVDRELFEHQGFPHLADLLFLRRALEVPCPIEGAPLSFVTYTEGESARFAAVLEQTYRGSCDCPRLNGLRTGAEALLGHQFAGQFDPRLWRVYRSGESDVGVLLFANHPDQHEWELTYMGIVPEHRGKGLGRKMIAQGLEQARASGATGVFLAVDEKNRYARRLYEDMGFAHFLSRTVMARLADRSEVR
ncbi:MAG TPA: GNAT family N-acetyltransferase [Planctomycetaceae bacterium]|nr:GNAT family N-acetyltransferase [Planctomycetaceae bacterium]